MGVGRCGGCSTFLGPPQPCMISEYPIKPSQAWVIEQGEALAFSYFKSDILIPDPASENYPGVQLTRENFASC